MKHIENILNFDIIRKDLANMSSSKLGWQGIMEMELTDNMLVINSELDLVEDMKLFISMTNRNFSGAKDLREIIETLIDKQLLSVQIIYDIAKLLDLSKKTFDFVYSKRKELSSIYEICEEIETFEELTDYIFSIINSDLEIQDNASTDLKNIRQQIRSQQIKLKNIIQASLKTYTQSGYTQNKQIFFRNNLYVIAVKSEYKNKIKGIIHDESSSGSTVFIEPLESAQINSTIRQLKSQETQIINQILRNIASEIYSFKEEIYNNILIIEELDIIYAKAKYAIKYGCNRVNINDQNITNIYTGYHPVLLKQHGFSKTIPLNLEIGENFSTLLITGPNAGGKTVTLKTIGLFAIMIRAGMQIPATKDSNIAIYNKIFTDIGDNQSIQNDLSTFSSNIKNLSNIFRNQDNQTLVLLDELGSSTDPAEGSAISMAVLKELTSRRYTTIATTHQGVLKSFAYQEKYIENGSMEFDQKKLTATYKFRPHIPGSSYAFEIAKRYGLPQKILHEAKKYLATEKQDMEKMITELNNKISGYNQLLRESKQAKIKLEELKDHYHSKNQKLQKERKDILRKATVESEKILTGANSFIEKAIAEIKEQKASKNTIIDIKNKLKKTKIDISQKKDLYRPQSPEHNKYNGQIEIGQEVRIKGFTNTGIVDTIKSKKVKVAVGQMQFWINKDDITDVIVSEKEISFNYEPSPENENISMRLDLRGMRGEDAISKLDKYLSEIAIAGLRSAEIIHGKGNGILDKMVNTHLEKHPLIKEKRYGKYGEGDFGVTIIDI